MCHWSAILVVDNLPTRVLRLKLIILVQYILLH